MGIAETLFFYACVGCATALALAVATTETPMRAAALFLPRAALWPFFAPSLFGGALQKAEPPRRAAPDDDLGQLEHNLVGALERLDGVAEEVLAPEVARVRSLTAELRRMRRRIDEMRELRGSPEFDMEAVESALAEVPEDDPRRATLESRRRSIDQLHEMLARTTREYDRVVLQLQELHSKILLLRFADDPEDEVVALMHDISSSVEGVCVGMFGR